MAGTEEHTSFSIGELARRSGVPVVTIRAWEQRYGLLAPDRSTGGHRRFTDEDLRRISAVRTLVSEGVTLAAAAERVMGSTDTGARRAGTERVRRGRGRVPTPAPLPSAGLDPQALEATYRATRALLHARSAGQVVEILIDLVRELGGAVMPADDAGPDAMPLDLSLGEGPPVLPVADPYSVARLQLERVLPTALEDARRAAALLRGISRRAEDAKPRR